MNLPSIPPSEPKRIRPEDIRLNARFSRQSGENTVIYRVIQLIGECGDFGLLHETQGVFLPGSAEGLAAQLNEHQAVPVE